jgi:hypothetical protein
MGQADGLAYGPSSAESRGLQRADRGSLSPSSRTRLAPDPSTKFVFRNGSTIVTTTTAYYQYGEYVLCFSARSLYELW